MSTGPRLDAAIGVFVGVGIAAQACEDADVSPCLSYAIDDTYDGETNVGPCLSFVPDVGDTYVGPCLGAPLEDVVTSADTGLSVCLSALPPDVEEDVGTGPCLEAPVEDAVGPCLSMPAPDVGAAPPSPADDADPPFETAANLRDAVRDRLIRAGVLPADVAARLQPRRGS